MRRHPDEDFRAGRQFSEIRHNELEQIDKKSREGKPTRIYQCYECKRIFEERSLYCPFCDKKVMGELVRIKGK